MSNKQAAAAVDLDVRPKSVQMDAALPPPERIVRAARELFCRDGIHATGIDRILAAAGASKMTLYTRFGSKDALLHEVLLREGADWRASFFAAVDATTPPHENALSHLVAALGVLFRQSARSTGGFYGCAFMNAAAEHTKGEAWLRDLAADHHRQILETLTAHAITGGYADPAILSRQLLLLLDGAIAALMVSGDPAVLDIAERNLRAVLRRD